MGNCQAVDAAALVIQHPDGKIERMYWPVSANEVMRTNPGHYVSLIIPLPVSPEEEKQDQKTVHFTRVKLLRPTDTLSLGHAYRLVTSQEVMRVLRAKKNAKQQQQHMESLQNEKAENPQQDQSSGPEREGKSDKGSNNQGKRHERHRPRTTPANPAAMRWILKKGNKLPPSYKDVQRPILTQVNTNTKVYGG